MKRKKRKEDSNLSDVILLLECAAFTGSLFFILGVLPCFF